MSLTQRSKKNNQDKAELTADINNGLATGAMADVKKGRNRRNRDDRSSNSKSVLSDIRSPKSMKSFKEEIKINYQNGDEEALLR